jgi:hypothetical protein
MYSMSWTPQRPRESQTSKSWRLVSAEIHLTVTSPLYNFNLTAHSKFETDIGSSETYNLHEAIWVCNSILSKIPRKYDTKRVWIMTNNDDPHKNDEASRKSVATRAKDLIDLGASVKLFALANAERSGPFNFNNFYRVRSFILLLPLIKNRICRIM